jgi:hypothetical protein
MLRLILTILICYLCYQAGQNIQDSYMCGWIASCVADIFIAIVKAIDEA